MGNVLTAVNPATAEVIKEIPESTDEQIAGVYALARAALATWRTSTVADRAGLFRSLRQYLVEHLDEIAETVSSNTGKVHFESLSTDVLPVLEALRHIEKGLGQGFVEKVPTPLLSVGKKSYIEYKPRGVVLVIAPWNFPLQLTLVPVLYAVAGGNTVILKPSEVTPLIGELIERLFKATGWPQDVVQVVHGGKETGAKLVAGTPDFIFFTGSVRTGRIIQESAAKRLIPTTLELGGKDPMVVFSDAPVDRAVQGALWGGLLNSGQVCMSVERVYVERPLFELFVERLKDAVEGLSQGYGMDHDVGSMTFQLQIDVVRDHVADALAKGATLVTGLPPEAWDLSKGLYLPPMVLTGVTQDMKIMQEETFGPVLPVLAFDTEAEAVSLANDSVYALSGSVWSKDPTRARRVASQLISGNVLVNDVVITIVNHNLPYGGEKFSGIGRYHGAAGVRTFCVATSTMADAGKRRREVNWFPYRGKYPVMASLLRAYYGTPRRWGGFIRAYLKLLRMSR